MPSGPASVEVVQCSAIPRKFGEGTKHLHADYVTAEGANFLALNIKAWQQLQGICTPELWEVISW